MLHVAPQAKHISIMADDADIFLLALHHYPDNLNCRITMESLTYESKVIDITATVKKHKNIVPYLLQLHAFTGSDISGSYCSIGKVSSLTLLKNKKLHFTYLGNLDFEFSLVLDEALVNLCKLYGVSKKCQDISELRYEVWCKKMGNAKQLVLKNLPPTQEAFVQNVKRAHYTVALWKSANQIYSVEVDLKCFGLTEINNILVPDMGEILVAPPDILKMLSCSCKSNHPCRTCRCNCHNAKLPCTVFCKCKAICENPTLPPVYFNDEDDEELNTEIVA